MTRVILIVLISCTAVLTIGCARGSRPGLPPGFAANELGDFLKPLENKLYNEGERNWVLNLNAIAIGALRQGERTAAKRALDESILLIEAIYGDSEQARRARSLWFREESKVFKGDPYERSMTYFYRGVLYMQDHEWDNARACFRSVLFHDSLAEDLQKRSDWVLPHFLIGVCETQMNRPDFAEESFSRAQTTYLEFVSSYRVLESSRGVSPLPFSASLPIFNETMNVLVLTQHGRAPIKRAAGTYGELLSYAPGGGSGSEATVSIDSVVSTGTEYVDSVYYQAATRGGREVDEILNRQASIRGGAEAAGNVAVMGGAVVAAHGISNRDDTTALAGAGVLAAGALMYGLSTLVQPQADTREWASLPDALGVAVIAAEPGSRSLTVSYAGEDVRRSGGNTKASHVVEIPQPGKGLAVVLAFPPPAVSLVTGSHPESIMENES